MKKVERELSVISCEFHSLTSDYGDYFLKDNDGNIYHWNTASNKMYEWYLYNRDLKYICKFAVKCNWISDKYGNVTTINNVRF